MSSSMAHLLPLAPQWSISCGASGDLIVDYHPTNGPLPYVQVGALFLLLWTRMGLHGHPQRTSVHFTLLSRCCRSCHCRCQSRRTL